VLAAGEFDVVTRGRRVTLAGPRVVRHARVPAPVRAILNALDVSDYVVARPSASK
jgi:hypothetical protein